MEASLTKEGLVATEIVCLPFIERHERKQYYKKKRDHSSIGIVLLLREINRQGVYLSRLSRYIPQGLFRHMKYYRYYLSKNGLYEEWIHTPLFYGIHQFF